MMHGCEQISLDKNFRVLQKQNALIRSSQPTKLNWQRASPSGLRGQAYTISQPRNYIHVSRNTISGVGHFQAKCSLRIPRPHRLTWRKLNADVFRVIERRNGTARPASLTFLSRVLSNVFQRLRLQEARERGHPERSRRAVDVFAVDGRKIKNAAKRLKPSRGYTGTPLGGKTLAALDLRRRGDRRLQRCESRCALPNMGVTDPPRGPRKSSRIS
jgi:hypothetical protein